MIFQSHVRRIGEQHLRLTLATVPSAITALLHISIWPRWVELATERCNELDRMNAIPSAWALDRFIEDAVVAYARVQLTKIGAYSELLDAQKITAAGPKLLPDA